MTEENQKSFNDFVELASDIVSSYVSNNSVPASELPGLIINVHAALTGLSSPETAAAPAEEVIEKPSSGQIRKSVTPDAIISFIADYGTKAVSCLIIEPLNAAKVTNRLVEIL